MEYNIFYPGPLYDKRKEIVSKLKAIPLETGDIVFNAADVQGPLGIPFSKWIQKFTKSPYSHATIILKEDDETYAIDVSDRGTRKVRLVDWFDDWYMTDFCIYRLKNKTPEDTNNFKKEIYKFLEMDPSYDFNFNDPSAFYCTESVKYVYKNCGYDLKGAYTIKEILPTWFYYVVKIGSFFTKIISNASIPSNVPIAIVGNKQKGMIASELIEEIFKG